MIFADQPITNSTNDTLNRRRFVEQMSHAILAWELREPLVIGVYGRWGDGKSSILHLLTERLTDRAATTFFDPWFFNSQEELIRAFLLEIFRVITEKLPWHSKLKIRNGARRFTQMLTSIPISLNYAGIDLSLRDLTAGQNSPTKLKDELSKNLVERRKHDTRKIVVLIDNIDRLSPDEILLMLKLIRLCSDFEDIIFVLAFDDMYVIQVLDQLLQARGKGISGEEYLKKIVQTDVRLPAIDLKIVDKFIDSAFDELQKKHKIEWDDDFSKRFPKFYNERMRGKLIRNLRDAKKFVNAVAFSVPLVLGEVNYADWLVMEAVRVFCHLSYSIARDNIHLLSPDYTKLGFTWAEHEKREYNAEIEKLLEPIDDQVRDFSIVAFEYLFPVFAAWRRNSASPQLPSGIVLADLSMQQRIGSPDYREAYFQFGPEPWRLPDTRVTEFIHKLNKAETGELPTRMREHILQVKSEGHLKSFLDKLILRASKIDRAVDLELVETIASLAHIYSRERDFFIDSEEDRARALIYAVIAENGDQGHVQTLLEAAIEKSSADIFAVSTVVFSRPKHNRILRDFSLVNDDQLKEKLRSRLREVYSVNGSDIFLLGRPEYAYILYQWAGPLLDDSTKVMEYLEAEIRSHPTYIGKFLEVFVKSDILFNDEERWVFDIKSYREAFDENWLHKLISETQEDIYETEREGWALENFNSYQTTGTQNAA